MIKYKHFFILILSAFLLVACSSAKENNPNQKNLTLLFNFSADTIDPHIDRTYTALRSGVTETLIKINENLKLSPWLAESWESEDGRMWKIHIRKGVKFHNGKLVDAEAVKNSLQRAMDENPAIKAALKIKKMEAKEQILFIETEDIFPSFPSELVHPNTAIIDVNEKDIDKKPIGTGPFQISSFTSGVSLQVKRFEDYWDGKARLAQATFAFNEDANARYLAIKSGDADIIFRPPIESMEELKKDKNIRVQAVPSLRVHQLTMNMRSPFMSDIYMRKAIDSLLDRKEVVEHVLNGQGSVASGPFLSDFPFSFSYEKEITTGINAARQYLEQGGYVFENGKLKKNGNYVQLKMLTYSARPELPIIAQLLQARAKELGIDISIQQVENIDEYLTNMSDWDIATYSNLTAPRGDSSYYLNATYMKQGALNYGGVTHKRLTQIIDELNKTMDEKKRNELTREALQIIHDEVLHSFVVYPHIVVAYKDYVKNLVIDKSEYYMITKDLDVKNEDEKNNE
ncbi:ABC transporter substrate-binding protein [Anoxybacillus ayderensis]|uniref:nickel ABC transporter substrate-binding protein n=1 Tax=Anoxybacillus sp. ST70 TaxID=2864180 RepID=UPI0002D803E1|nr:nickel ABC transporter substrate-binding protein [Anoxybacillus sp. ST70]AXM90173.1 ABC transporter substrate-binding protein [Anoxybacillus ayderensis G10]MBW9218280.1 ABC transporter substrate-binding protein [Anoxybacillus sp. ST70]THD17643.1 ABC transporter substrate-binding protein [Anoxybacillus ayderensis]